MTRGLLCTSSRPVEGFGVGEPPTQRWVTGRQSAYLEVRPPLGLGRSDAAFVAEDKAESGVVARVAEQSNQRFVERVGGAEHGVHECVTDPASLLVGPDAERSECEHRDCVDSAAGAQSVADDLAGGAGRDERERRQPRLTGTKFAAGVWS